MEETIDLGQIIKNIIKGKWIIISTTIICLLISGVISWLLLPEKYESKAVVQIANNVQDTGIISNYVSTEFTTQVFTHRIKNEQIINAVFSKNGLENLYDEKNLRAVNEVNTNLVNLTYISDSPENAQKELDALISITKDEMNNAVQTTLENLEKTYKTEADVLSNEIETIIDEYNKLVQSNDLPEVLILQTLLNSEIVLDITEEQIKALTNVSGALQNELLQLQAQIQTKSDEYRKVLSYYQSVKTGLESFKPDPFIRIITEPTIIIEPVSPNKILNLFIGFVFGVLIGLVLVFLNSFRINTKIPK